MGLESQSQILSCNVCAKFDWANLSITSHVPRVSYGAAQNPLTYVFDMGVVVFVYCVLYN